MVKCSDEMYIAHSAHESAICCLLFTTFSHCISFSYLVFLCAFHSSRLLSDACRYVRFNSLRGFHTSFILQATSFSSLNLVFPSSHKRLIPVFDQQDHPLKIWVKYCLKLQPLSEKVFSRYSSVILNLKLAYSERHYPVGNRKCQ